MSALQAFNKIDQDLGDYYELMGRTDYYDENGMGKFKSYVNEQEYDEGEIEDEMQSAPDCGYIDFLDAIDEFPFPKDWRDKTTEDKNQFVFNQIKQSWLGLSSIKEVAHEKWGERGDHIIISNDERTLTQTKWKLGIQRRPEYESTAYASLWISSTESKVHNWDLVIKSGYVTVGLVTKCMDHNKIFWNNQENINYAISNEGTLWTKGRVCGFIKGIDLWQDEQFSLTLNLKKGIISIQCAKGKSAITHLNIKQDSFTKYKLAISLAHHDGQAEIELMRYKSLD